MHARGALDPIVSLHSAYGPFTKHQGRIEVYKRTGDLSKLYKNTLDKACFVHDSAYAKYKDLDNRLVSDKVLQEPAEKIAADQTKDGYQRMLATMVSKFFTNQIMQEGSGLNKQLSEGHEIPKELHCGIQHNFPTPKVVAMDTDNIWSADLVDIQKLKHSNSNNNYLFTVIVGKYMWVIQIIDKREQGIVKAFSSILTQNKKIKRSLG